MTIALYLLAYAALPLFGWPFAAWIDDRSAWIGWAFMAGALLLTIEATLFSMAGVRWSVWGLAIIPTVATIAVMRSGTRRTRRTGRAVRDEGLVEDDEERNERRTPAAATRAMGSPGLALLIIVASVVHFALAILTTQAVSSDYLLFWGVKAVRFALARGIDPAFLFTGYSPPQPDYPPLVPVVQGWGTLLSGDMPWLTGAAMSAVWLLAAALVIRWLLRMHRVSDYGIAFWTAAMALSMAASDCGGNAEPMLIAYLSVGAAAVVAAEREPRCRWIAAAAFAGAALSKAEALFAVATILTGLAIRDLVLRDRGGIRRLALYGAATVGGIGIWFAYQLRFGRAIGFHRFTTVKQFYWSNLSILASEGPKNLAAGGWGLPWLVALAVVAIVAVRAPRRLIDALPLLVPVPLFFAFFVFLYLQYSSGLPLQLVWTLGRISQPPLSLLILGAAFLSARPGIESARHEPR